MVVNFSRTKQVTSSVSLDGKDIEKVNNFKYLGTYFSNDLKWHTNTDYIYSKLKSRFYAFYKFKSFKPSHSQQVNFIKILVLPILLYNAEIWFFSASKIEVNKLVRLFKSWNSESFYISEMVKGRMIRLATKIRNDERHVLKDCYVLSRRCFISAKCRCDRYLNSFIPTSIRFLNELVIR